LQEAEDAFFLFFSFLKRVRSEKRGRRSEEEEEEEEEDIHTLAALFFFSKKRTRVFFEIFFREGR
jgi:hypothetical protein